jgi:hypothetical protein
VKELPYDEKCVVNVILEFSKIYFRYKCPFPGELLRIHRASSTLNASIIHLYPDANYTKLGQQYFRQADGPRENSETSSGCGGG